MGAARANRAHARVSPEKNAKALTCSSPAHYVWTCGGRKESNEQGNADLRGVNMKSKPSLPGKATQPQHGKLAGRQFGVTVRSRQREETELQLSKSLSLSSTGSKQDLQ